MPRVDPTFRDTRTFALIAGVVIVGVLYFAKELLLPFALAILVSFLLAPLVERLERKKLNRIAAVLLTVSVATASLTALSFVLLRQVYDFAHDLPNHRENIVSKARAVIGNQESMFDMLGDFLKDLQADLAKNPLSKSTSNDDDSAVSSTTQTTTSTLSVSTQSMLQPPPTNPPPTADGQSRASDARPNNQPVIVQIQEELTVTEMVQSVAGPVLPVLGTAALVLIFVIFILLEREDLRNRLIHLTGSQQLNITTQALDDAAGRVSRFLLMQLIINVAYGVVIAIGLFFIGLPNAFMWGVLTTVLRFVPYVGPWIAAVVPIAISLAVFKGWTQPALVIGLFVVNELISNNILEPWLYGTSTGISTIGVLTSAVFWTWLWGPIGLVMATPLTVCFMVLSRNIPQMSFLNTLFSDEQVLPPKERFYQRLLASDPDEAQEVIDDYLKENKLESLYDNVLMPALSLAEQDRHHNRLDDEKQQFILQTMRDVLDDLGTKAKQTAADASDVDGKPRPAPTSADECTAVLCLPARDEADEIAGLIFSQLLEARGVACRVLSTKTLAGEMVAEVDRCASGVVCISALPPFAATHARYLSKRLRPKYPKLRIVVGLWQTSSSSKKAQQRLMDTGVDKVVNTLAEASELVAGMAQAYSLTSAGTAQAELISASATRVKL